MKSRQGFTLIELILVVQIIAILAVAAAPVFINLRFQAAVAATRRIQSEFVSVITMENARRMIAGQPVMTCTDMGGPCNFDFNTLYAPLWAGGRVPRSPLGDEVVFVRANAPNVIVSAGNSWTCSEIQSRAQSTGSSWFHSTVTQRVYSATPDCSAADPTTW